jgi:hypothetical protein
LLLLPLRDLKEFVSNYGITGKFTEKRDLIEAIVKAKGHLNEDYFRTQVSVRNAASRAANLSRKSSSANLNPVMAMFKNVFSDGNQSSSSSSQASKPNFMRNFENFAGTIQKVYMGLDRRLIAH